MLKFSDLSVDFKSYDNSFDSLMKLIPGSYDNIASHSGERSWRDWNSRQVEDVNSMMTNQTLAMTQLLQFWDLALRKCEQTDSETED